MTKHRILHSLILALLLVAGLTVRSSATSETTSEIVGYQADHYEGTSWVITQINGQLINTEAPPDFEILNGSVFVNQGCPSFVMSYPDEQQPMKTQVTFVATFAPCNEMTPQQKAVAGVFQTFEQFSPKGKDSIFVFAHDHKWLVAVRQK